MDLPVDSSRISSLYSLNQWIAGKSIDYWHRRLHEVGIYLDENLVAHADVATFPMLETNRLRLFRLLKRAIPFPEAQMKAAELMLMLDPFLDARGYYAQWGGIAQQLLVELDNGALDVPLIAARLWYVRGQCYRQQGDMTRASVAFRRADNLAHYRDLDIQPRPSEPRLDLVREIKEAWGSVRSMQYRLADAEQMALELLDDARAWGDIDTESRGRMLLAFTYLHAYRAAEAFEQAQQAYFLCRRLRDVECAGWSMHYMGEAMLIAYQSQQRGAHHAYGRLAAAYLDRARVMAQDSCSVVWEARIEQSRSKLAKAQGRLNDAIRHLGRAIGLFSQQDDQRSVVTCIHDLGLLYLESGDYARAESLLHLAVKGWEAYETEFQAINAVYGLAYLYSQSERYTLATSKYREALDRLSKLPDSPEKTFLEREIRADMANIFTE